MFRYIWAMVCALTLMSGHMALAQGTAKGNRLLLAQRAERGGSGEAAWQLLKQPMSLPDLPMYTGRSKFKDGLMYPNKPGGPAITLRYLAVEEPAVVLDWYDQALKNYQWKIDKHPLSSSSISAKRGSNGVVVRVTESKQGKFKSFLQISYKLNSK